jgi:hypothetical protein
MLWAILTILSNSTVSSNFLRLIGMLQKKTTVTTRGEKY